MIECLRNLSTRVEILLLLYGFSYMFEGSITTNFLLYRTCYVTLGYNIDDCYLLGTKYANNRTKELETKVQTYTTYIIMSKSLIEAFIAPLFCFLLAAWSDKYGRRPLMLFGLTGLLMSYVVMTVVSSLPYISPWYFLLHEIPFCIFGSKISLLAACISYVADTVPEENRGIRLGFLEATSNIGMLIGTTSCSYIFTAFGYNTIYVICATCQFLAWMFTWFCIEESLNVDESERKWSSLIQLSPIKETMMMIFRRRENNNRTVLLCIFGVVVIFMGGKYSNSSVIFLYLREKFTWSLEDYTLFVAFSLLTWIILCVVCIKVLVNIMRIKETTTIIIALLLNTSGYLVQGFANATWQIYGAACLLSIGSCVAPLSHLLLSKLVPKEEIGRLYAAMVSFDSISLLLGSTLNTFIYNQTIAFIPQGFNFVTAIIYALSLTLAM
ncbi:hypothetical protein RI129_002365 [Pyrocoelia pectoralis]|uniref:Major facilitator superfamily (MFS) profile domain-containing protein n=1 Tax=Pyrocoelia pectoralis TaxID=417401 RepID=A0AAN7VMD4_9COLE